MQNRIYTFLAGVQQSAAPDPGTPASSADVIPFSYMGTIVEQEAPTGALNGSNTAFTLAHTPLSGWPFALFLDGIKLILGTDYTRTGTAITMTTAPASNQVLTADYRY